MEFFNSKMPKLVGWNSEDRWEEIRPFVMKIREMFRSVDLQYAAQLAYTLLVNDIHERDFVKVATAMLDS